MLPAPHLSAGIQLNGNLTRRGKRTNLFTASFLTKLIIVVFRLAMLKKRDTSKEGRFFGKKVEGSHEFIEF